MGTGDRIMKTLLILLCVGSLLGCVAVPYEPFWNQEPRPRYRSPAAFADNHEGQVSGDTGKTVCGMPPDKDPDPGPTGPPGSNENPGDGAPDQGGTPGPGDNSGPQGNDGSDNNVGDDGPPR